MVGSIIGKLASKTSADLVKELKNIVTKGKKRLLKQKKLSYEKTIKKLRMR